jgi:hypothetical protein
MARVLNRELAVLGFLLLFVIGFPASANAYIDPGTGSYIFQTIIAVVIGASFTIKLYWNKIKTFLTSLFSKGTTDDKRE